MSLIERIYIENGMTARGAIVVAHPDDEALFFAGMMLQWQISWDVICCTFPKSDPIRGWKFYDSCAILNATPKLMPIEETPLGQPLKPLTWEILLPELEPYDVVVTHSDVGEYSHNQHVEISRFVGVTCPAKTLFGRYGMEQGDIVCALDDEQWNRKLLAIEAYNNVRTDGIVTSDLLKRNIGGKFDLRRETYGTA